ncbi:condensation domain-containing protein [Desulfosporosinus shakirovi]|uniref:condensation domain-containing protein n=1 Tax=Desulfosporosinus shakirovi TaxID=2885154 RepID=UPI001E3F5778|nr:condensation domain-containing protein [Desulfosporosinus sp. SRJS8]MCB8816722.1 condensation domain-containing protein [Desulfosporosinus sp. SRJS8]
MDRDIGIIGISGILPKARNLREFRRNLREGRDCITPAPRERLKLLGLAEDREYMELGFIDDIEYFDHAFFNISGKEADYMSPEQRLSLELVAAAIWDAGYSLEAFRGKNCGLIVSCSDNEYEGLLKNRTSLSFLGSLKSMTSGIIAYYFDLHGPNIILDTGCSSTLVGIHEACQKLISGEVDYALAGGIAVSLTLAEANAGSNDILGIESSDGRCKSFAAQANGTGFGEGGGYLLLKRLQEAVAEGDHIYGVIKGSAINGDGFRCSSITTPSVPGQKEAILKAWQAGRIDPREITEIEAHGTGTKLGDPIEVTSVTESLNAYKVSRPVHLGSVKSNIGHLGYTAGIAGVLKVLLGFKYHEVYPLVHYKKPNPLIDFENSPLQPTTQVLTWEPGVKRIAGINSFGLSGTNAHLVIETYDREEKEEAFSERTRLLKVSAKSPTAFYATLHNLKSYFAGHQVNFNHALYTLNTGRDDYPFRRLLRVRDREDLLEQLDMAAYVRETEAGKLVFVLTAPEEGEPDPGEEFCRMSPLFQSYWEKARGRARTKAAMYQYLKDLGLEADYVMADAAGKRIIQYGRGEITEHELEAEVEKLSETDSNPEETDFKPTETDSKAAENGSAVPKILEQIRLLRENYPLLLVNMGGRGLAPEAEYGHEVREFRLDSCLQLEKLLVAVYNSGRNICWDNYYQGLARKRVSLPGYCFDKTRHWLELRNPRRPEEEDRPAETTAPESPELAGSGNPEEETLILKTIWQDVLEYGEEIGDEEDFFDLGGNSLLITMLTEDIARILRVKIEVAQVYDYNTIAKQLELIRSKRGTGPRQPAGKANKANKADETYEADRAVKADKADKTDFTLSSMQKTILYSQEKYPDRASWNLSIALKVGGRLEGERMLAAMRKVEENHELLRCIIVKTEDGEHFKLSPPENNLELISLAEGEGSDEEKEASVRRLIKEEAMEPMALYHSPLTRLVIYTLAEDAAYLLLKIHHIIADGWALSILFRELCRYYVQPDYKPGKESVSFREFVDYEHRLAREEQGQRERNYWQKEMDGFHYPREFPVKKANPATSVIDVEYLILDMKTTQSLRDYVKERRASVFQALLMTYHLSLAKLWGIRDSCIGMMAANRNNKGFAATLGLLARVLPNRIRINAGESVETLLKTVKQKSTEALENQHCSLQEAMAEVSPQERAALDDLLSFLIVYQNFGEINIEAEGLKFTTFITNERSALCPLALIIYESEKVIMVSVEYDPGYFTVQDIKLFTKTFQEIVSRVLAQPSLAVRDLMAAGREYAGEV